MRYIPNGTAVTNFSLAVNNRRRDENGDWTENTEWFDVTTWGHLAESVNWDIDKGRKIFVEGRLSTSHYTSSSGEARTSLEVRASNVRLLDSPNAESTNGGAQEEDPSAFESEEEKRNFQRKKSLWLSHFLREIVKEGRERESEQRKREAQVAEDRLHEQWRLDDYEEYCSQAMNFDNYYDQTGWWMKDPWDQPGTDPKYGSVP
jgi:single-strand DNA-binding protein